MQGIRMGQTSPVGLRHIYSPATVLQGLFHAYK